MRPYPGPGERHTISTNGGQEPVWSRDGRELFFRSGDQVLVVAVQTAESFEAAVPQELFSGTYASDTSGGGGAVANYDIAPSGQLLMLEVEREFVRETRQINVVLNWHKELLERVPIP